MGERIRDASKRHGATARLIMPIPAWEENMQSDFMHRMERTFIDNNWKVLMVMPGRLVRLSALTLMADRIRTVRQRHRDKTVCAKGN
ncbi:MAG: hypothetical protein J5957_11650 [Prevotella sp.]|nr:hypothetical protein [Prevotella sp.]